MLELMVMFNARILHVVREARHSKYDVGASCPHGIVELTNSAMVGNGCNGGCLIFSGGSSGLLEYDFQSHGHANRIALGHSRVLQDLLQVILLADGEEAFLAITSDMHVKEVSGRTEICEVKALFESSFEGVEVVMRIRRGKHVINIYDEPDNSVSFVEDVQTVISLTSNESETFLPQILIKHLIPLIAHLLQPV
jgi:hypothetical protein